MVVSDPFDQENQGSPLARADQLQWLELTAESRLDESGRLIILGTRVAPYDNYGILLERYTKGAHVIFEDGYYQKWSNGTATVVYPALQYNEDGDEISYWPERFPLNDYFELPSGEAVPVEGLSDEQHMEIVGKGAKRARGLRGIREDKAETFATAYQQNPPESTSGDFTQALLDHCDDVDRTVGVVQPGEILVLGVDPARSGGASWVLWGWHPKKETATVIDLFYGERLGMQGLREKLILEPIRRYMPRYFVYEANIEASVLEHPEIKDALRETATELVLHRTGRNRSDSDVGLPGMVFKMRDGTIRFPARTADDVRVMQGLKQHFLAWDAKSVVERARVKHIPDDRAMAAWVGFTKVRDLMTKQGRMIPQPQVNAAVRKAFGSRRVREGPVREPVKDWVAVWNDQE